jgi:vacuolar-type H+-ATPase subunit I/STV1
MIKASEILEFLQNNMIYIDSDVEEEIRTNDAISYNNLSEITIKLMGHIQEVLETNSAIHEESLELYTQNEEMQCELEKQQAEMESIKKELEEKAYQLYQEQLEKQQLLKANERLQALSEEFNKLSKQKDTLFTIIELMLNK